jgi:hypothetical protein
MDIEEHEVTVGVDNIGKEYELEGVEVGNDYTSSPIQVPAKANVTQPKGKYCYRYYRLLLVSTRKLMFR